ncbi:MAG: DNA replication protein psf2 [Caeruleum heppii]|nr:MAG: DNA replication protein psf2 [Caeruleum heppii]
MAVPQPPGLTPIEVAFLSEMASVTIIPRQRLDGLDLLGGSTKPLHPPHRSSVPLWLALLLKRQRRANIVPPPWLSTPSLESILETEVKTSPESFSASPELRPGPSPPFTPCATSDALEGALPYHWLELGEILLESASDDVVEPDAVRRLLRDLREVRLAKLRAGVDILDNEQVALTGVGGMEVAEGRRFIGGVIDGLRALGASREQARRERDAETSEVGLDEDDDDL